MKMDHWTTESVIRLVKEYRARPLLWDHENDAYRVQSAKYEAWSEIAEIFSCDIVDVRKKVNSLLASRRREKARVREGGRSTWFLYPYLNFLSGHIDNNDPPETENMVTEVLEQDASAADSDPTDAEEESFVVKREPVSYHYNTPQIEEKKKKLKVSKPKKPLKRKAKIEDQEENIENNIIDDNLSNLNTSNYEYNDSLELRIAEMMKLLRKTENSKKKDECDTFGEYIASSLRKHDDRTQSMIKQAINNILFEQEMKKYNSNATYTVIISDPTENPLGAVHLADDILEETVRK